MDIHEAAVKKVFQRFIGFADAVDGSPAVVVLVPFDGQVQRLVVALLQEVAAQVSAMGATAGTLAPEGKKGLASLIGTLLPIIQPMVTKALGIPDAGGLKPVLDTIMGGLTTLSKG